MPDIPLIPVTSPASISIFHALLTRGPMARVEIAQALGLSQAAVTKAIRPLLSEGFVELTNDIEPDPTRKGRPLEPIHLVADRVFTLGIKVTQDTLYSIGMNFDGSIQFSHITERSGEKSQQLIDDLVKCCRFLSHECSTRGINPDGIGISISGDVDNEQGIVRDSHLLGIHDFALADKLAEELEVPIFIDNDVRALTNAESLYGSGRNVSSWAVVTIGEGIGCGIYVNGKILTGAFGVAGELGHLPLGPVSHRCSCGKNGCVEAVASTPAIRAAIKEMLNEELTLDQALSRYTHDEQIRGIIDQADMVLADALGTLACLIGPSKIMLSGESIGALAAEPKRLENIRSHFTKRAFGNSARCELVLTQQTFLDWARGAASIVISRIARLS